MLGLYMSFTRFRPGAGFAGIFTSDFVGLQWFRQFFQSPYACLASDQEHVPAVVLLADLRLPRADHLRRVHHAGPRGLENVRCCVEELRGAYALMAKEGNLCHDVIEGGHHFGLSSMVDDYHRVGLEV